MKKEKEKCYLLCKEKRLHMSLSHVWRLDHTWPFSSPRSLIFLEYTREPLTSHQSEKKAKTERTSFSECLLIEMIFTHVLISLVPTRTSDDILFVVLIRQTNKRTNECFFFFQITTKNKRARTNKREKWTTGHLKWSHWRGKEELVWHMLEHLEVRRNKGVKRRRRSK